MCTLCPVTAGVAGMDISSLVIILLQACFFSVSPDFAATAFGQLFIVSPILRMLAVCSVKIRC